MKDVKRRAERQSRAVAAVARRRAVPFVLLLALAACALASLFAVRRVAAQNYARFSHSTPGAHAALTGRWSCSICHDRRGNSIEPTFPQHKDCISCHQTQFTTPDSPLCTICHQAGGLGQQNPPLKKFPGLAGFNTEFDHAQHNAGEARAQSGCNACHAPARGGVARTIPAGLECAPDLLPVPYAGPPVARPRHLLVRGLPQLRALRAHPRDRALLRHRLQPRRPRPAPEPQLRAVPHGRRARPRPGAASHLDRPRPTLPPDPRADLRHLPQRPAHLRRSQLQRLQTLPHRPDLPLLMEQAGQTFRL